MHKHIVHLLGFLLFAITALAAVPNRAGGSSISYDTDILSSRFLIEIEGGPVWQTRNDVQIPNNDQGTRFSFVDLAGTGPLPTFRAYLTWNIAPRHSLRVLVAPFKYVKSGTSNEIILFAGETYAPGDPIDATYKFNSYRLTYRYAFLLRERWRLWVGFSAKIRDAKIGLSQGATTSEDTDVGFVPLLNLGATFRASEHWRLLMDFDGLAGGPGRAFDVALKVGYDFNRHVSLNAGYRLLEGGADVEQVYNFSWFNYLVASVIIGF
jgi:hypothetical protein